MEERIINALTENRLFHGYYDKIEVNNEKGFFEKYKINRTSKNFIPQDIKRNSGGFLLFDDVPFITSNLIPDGHNNSFWILLSNGSRILLKEVDYDEISAELLFKCYTKSLDLPCATYDVVSLWGETYLASPSFLNPEEYLYNYYLLDKRYSSVVDVQSIIEMALKINHDLFVMKTLIIDMMTDNVDRFPNNFKTIKNKDHLRSCPLFDNSMWGEEKKTRITYPSINGSYDKDDLAEYLLKDSRVYTWCLNKIIKREIPDFKKDILSKKGIYVDDKINELFKENVSIGKQILLDAIKR